MNGAKTRRTLRRLAAGAAALALAALGAALVTGCGSGQPVAQSSPRTIEVAPSAATGTTVDARVGDIVVVSLDANPTTGYEWTFRAGDTFVIEKSEYVSDPNPDELVGSGGTQIVTLRITKAGTSDLTGYYARPWETPSPSPKPGVTVTVVAP